ncbi:MAG: arylesterase [Bacteriovorax sp.]|nr:arylesterase [Bacteriovorax sp.]
MKFFLFLFFLNFIFITTTIASTNILFLGDSLSEGQGVDEEQAFPRLVEKKLREKKFDVAVTNGGVSGATSASGESRLKWHLKQKTDILVLELGANDGLRGLKIIETEKNLRKIVQLAKKNHIKVLLLGLLMPPNYGIKYTKEFESMYKRISSVEKIPFLPFILKDIAGITELNQADGIHPNVRGHEIIAIRVSQFVEKNL